jgi:hypothetical protein
MATVATEQDQQPKDATSSPNQLFRYSKWVHVGDGAEGCATAEIGCTDPGHFHAWCRLPNQLQHEDIRERALAAKARRIRQMRDPAADAHEILESDMAELDRVAAVADLVHELVGKDWWKRQLEAMADVEEDEEFKHVEKDRERHKELRAMDPDARPRDEYEELDRHLDAYNTRVTARAEELTVPVRASLEQLSKEELIGQIREERVTAEAATAFMATYSRYSWLAGTYTSAAPVDRQRAFRSMEQLEEASPEVLEALRSTFAELETSLQRGPQGN